MAEYHVLFPGSILLAYLGLLALGAAGETVFGAGRDALLNALMEGQTPLAEVLDEEVVVCEADVIAQNGGSYCEQHALCGHIEPQDASSCTDFNDCQVNITQEIGVVVIKAGQNHEIFSSPSEGMGAWSNGNECYVVSVGSNSVSWIKIGSGKDCKDVSHVQAWAVPELSASCE